MFITWPEGDTVFVQRGDFGDVARELVRGALPLRRVFDRFVDDEGGDSRGERQRGRARVFGQGFPEKERTGDQDAERGDGPDPAVADPDVALQRRGDARGELPGADPSVEAEVDARDDAEGAHEGKHI